MANCNRTSFARIRAFAAAAALCAAAASVPCRGDVVAGTWNLKWFPSGRAEHRAPAAKEKAAESDAARVAAEAVSAMRGSSKDCGIILFLQEMRDASCTSGLVARAGIKDLQVASVSSFIGRDRRRDWQQCAIATTYPVLASGWRVWRQRHGVKSPRGYAWALVDAGKDGVIACFCVHMKSNYGDVAETEKMTTWLKRMCSAEQLIEEVPQFAAPDGRRATRAIVAGDFNTDIHAPEFDAEKTVRMFFADGWRDAFEGVPDAARATHPGKSRYRASTLDYILAKNMPAPAERRVFPSGGVSDHDAAFARYPSQVRAGGTLPVTEVDESFDD